MRFVRFVVVVMVILGAAASTEAQTFVESQTLITESGVGQTLDAQFIVPGKKLDFMAWALVSGGEDSQWGELLFGAAKNIKPWLWVGVVAGVETDENPFRVNPNVWVGHGRFSSFLAVEYGGSGYWYQSKSYVKVSERVSVGFHSQSFFGNGPSVKVNLGGKLAAWSSVAVDNRKVFMGLIRTF